MASQPEQQARAEIDRLLHAAGWHVFDVKEANIHAGRGAAIREFPLNAERVSWLSPEYQAPHAIPAMAAASSGFLKAQHMQTSRDIDTPQVNLTATNGKRVWPDGAQVLAAQIRAVADLLATSDEPIAATEIAKRFGKRATFQAKLNPLLKSLEAMGHARQTDDGQWMVV